MLLGTTKTVNIKLIVITILSSILIAIFAVQYVQIRKAYKDIEILSSNIASLSNSLQVEKLAVDYLKKELKNTINTNEVLLSELQSINEDYSKRVKTIEKRRKKLKDEKDFKTIEYIINNEFSNIVQEFSYTSRFKASGSGGTEVSPTETDRTATN